MAMIGVRIVALGLVLAVFCPSPQACAFGLRLGPFLLGWRAHHHHRHFVRRPTEGRHSEATPTDDAQNRAPSLIYPILAWPSFADDIFGPTNYSPGCSATKAFSIRPSRNIPPSVSLNCAPARSGRAMPLYESGARSRRPPRNSRCYKNSGRLLRKPTAI